MSLASEQKRKKHLVRALANTSKTDMINTSCETLPE